jgi:putative transcriptional regulator
MSTNSWLPPGFARLARSPGRGKVQSGSPVALLIESACDLRQMKTINAIESLVHRWMPLLRAKRAIEAMVYHHKAFVYVPKVESLDTLTQELAKSGVKATALPNAGIGVRAIRDKLDLTQEQFAVRYGLDVDAVRNWETGRRTPDTAAQSYLRAIRANPEAVEAALWADAAQAGDHGSPSDAAQADDPASPCDAVRSEHPVTPSDTAQAERCVTPSAA